MLFPALTWLGIGVDYILAGALIAVGGYLAFVLGANRLIPLSGLIRFAGLALIAAGLLVGAITFGKSLGASECEAAWKAKNYEAQIARLEQERDAEAAKARSNAAAAAALAEKHNADQDKIADYERSTGALSSALAACRRATGDDDRRLCDIVGAAAAGCQHP